MSVFNQVKNITGGRQNPGEQEGVAPVDNFLEQHGTRSRSKGPLVIVMAVVAAAAVGGFTFYASKNKAPKPVAADIADPGPLTPLPVAALPGAAAPNPAAGAIAAASPLGGAAAESLAAVQAQQAVGGPVPNGVGPQAITPAAPVVPVAPAPISAPSPVVAPGQVTAPTVAPGQPVAPAALSSMASGQAKKKPAPPKASAETTPVESAATPRSVPEKARTARTTPPKKAFSSTRVVEQKERIQAVEPVTVESVVIAR